MATHMKIITDLPKEMKKLNTKYRQSVLDAMAEHLDDIRERAIDKYIIPDVHPDKSVRAKTRLQKTDPKRLTSRTGALLKMLRTGKGQWTKGPVRRISRSPAVVCTVRTFNKNTNFENYEGRIGYNIKDPSQISKKRTAQQLAGRFFWDLPNGVRGRRRPFLSAASVDLFAAGNFRAHVVKRLKAIGAL